VPTPGPLHLLVLAKQNPPSSPYAMAGGPIPQALSCLVHLFAHSPSLHCGSAPQHRACFHGFIAVFGCDRHPQCLLTECESKCCDGDLGQGDQN
jgi:hypothetical protein